MKFYLSIFLKASICILLGLLSGCIDNEEPFTIEVTGPDSVFSWEEINYQVSSNKAGAELYCQWTYDKTVFYGNGSNGSCTHTPQNVMQDAELTLVVLGIFEEQEVYKEISIDVIYQYSLRKNKHTLSELTVMSQNQLINLADTALKLADFANSVAKEFNQFCYSDGTFLMTLNDKDSNGELTVGDIVSYEFDDCFLQSMGSTLTGHMEITIDAGTASNKLNSVTLNAQQLAIGRLAQHYEGVIVSGLVSVNRVREPQKIITNIYSDKFEFHQPDERYPEEQKTLILNNLLAYKSEDYDTALISNHFSYDAELITGEGNGRYLVNYSSPLQAYFGEYPKSGRIEIVNQQNVEDTVWVEASGVDSFLNLHIVDSEQNDEPFELAKWSGRVAYRLSDLPLFVVKNNTAGDLRLLGYFLEGDKFEVGDSLTVVFNRPLAVTESSGSFRGGDYGRHIVDGVIEIQNTKAKVSPSGLLHAGKRYDVYLWGVVSDEGVSGVHLSTTIEVSSNIIPVITMSQGYFTEFSLPFLSAFKSELNDGREFEYLWQVAEEIDVTFLQPEQMETEMSLSADINEDITVQLVMRNELGDKATSQKPLRYLDTSGSYMLIEGNDESYVSAGETWPLNEKDGEFDISTRPWADAENSRAFISVKFVGEDYWQLQVEAPAGTNLAVGRYQGAARYPFQEDNVAGLDFSGQHKGCNQSFSDFEIFEIEFDDNLDLVKLAMDFDLACEQIDRERLKGVVRINSALPFDM